MAAKAPGRDIGWDHIHVNFGATAAACKLLGLGYEQSRQAVGIATASYNPLRVIRTGAISMYKGVASANMARNGVYTALLARNGMEGPTDAFEGQKGWEEIVQGCSFEVSFGVDQWIREVMMKRYMAGTHAQPAIEGLLELVERESIDPTAIEEIHLETYASAKHVMGGGEGDRHLPANREQADHSIPYTLAAAALDGQLLSPQYEPDRIASDDVRRLMGTVTVAEDPALSDLFDEGAQPYDISVTTGDGQRHQIEKRSFQGHPETPMSWAHLEEKFHTVAADAYDRAHRQRIVTTVRNLEQHRVADLTALL
jgi:2-methylcitrate dehydratase